MNRRYKEQVAFERLVIHAFELPHVVSTFRVLKDVKYKKSIGIEGPVRRGRLKTVAGTRRAVAAFLRYDTVD